MRYDARVLKRLVAQDFDVVHAWQEPYCYPCYQIAQALRGTRARFCFRTAQNNVKRYPFPFCYFERKALARTQGWIAGASLVYRAMLQRRFPAEQGRIINLAVETGLFRPLDEREKTAVLRELRLEPPVIGFVGRLTESKGLDVLMKAVERVSQPQWSLLLLGSGPYEARIKRWAAQRGWSDRVCSQLVRHEDVPQYLGAMDVLVAPSQTRWNWREQFGRMLIEAFGCGVPIIGSDSGEIPYVIGDAGRVVPEADVAGWAGAIERLLKDDQARNELAQRGLRRARQFSVEHIAGQYREFYRWLANQAA
jgi:glycosyltransferase involved in cell wall biosynthesis